MLLTSVLLCVRACVYVCVSIRTVILRVLLRFLEDLYTTERSLVVVFNARSNRDGDIRVKCRCVCVSGTAL